MYIVGLTGGIASGKSVVARRLAELGAVHVDADALAREVVKPGTPALRDITQEFGKSVIAADGSLNRTALGAIIFANPDKREILNSITHPAIWTRAKELFDDAERADPDAVVVYDVPLLVESASKRPLAFDLIVVVHAESSIRLDRLVSLRGMSPDEAENRIRSQASDDQRLAFADVVIESNGTLDETYRQVAQLWEKLRTVPADLG